MRKYGSCVLSKFKLIFKVSSWIGTFPCFIKEGFIWKAKSPLFCISSWLLWFLVVNAGCAISIWVFISQAKEDFTVHDYFAAFFKDSKTMLDRLTFGAAIVLAYCIGTILAIQLGSKGKSLEVLTHEHFVFMPKLKKEAAMWPLLNKVFM